jgi:peroxiredoxin family protein
MHNTKREIEHIINQSNKWIKFGIIAPIVFFSIAFIAHLYEVITLVHVAWTAGVVTAVVCFTWWFWALRVIVKMGEINQIASDDLTEVAKDVRMMSTEVREANRSLYEILKQHKKNLENK